MLASSRRPRDKPTGRIRLGPVEPHVLGQSGNRRSGPGPARKRSPGDVRVEGRLLGTLRRGGLDGAVDSWVSTGQNQSVEPQQLGAALGPDNVNQISAKSGLPVEALLPLLATFLPMIIDRLTPDGNAPQTGADNEMGQIGDILGGLLGGSR
jgi:uncharacterized protein YidB (DUF937 family)